jgi:PleD family two-component response regulator
VVSLIDAREYEKAKSIIGDMKERGFLGGQLLLMMEKGDFNKAREIASSLQNEFKDKVTQVAAAKPGREQKTVLAVDDRPEIITLVNNALRSHYKTLGAPSGKIALDIIHKHTIDFFILDIDMPEMDGFELMRQIRNERKYKDTPIVFLTGNSSRERIVRAINMGVCDFIVKPAYNETLLIKTQKYID